MDRRAAILNQLSKSRRVTVDELVALLDASPATVRRDLSSLEIEGKLVRTHGGATLAPAAPGEANFLTRQRTAAAEKQAIAQAAAKKITSGSTVFLDSGSTTYELAKLLIRQRACSLYTNSLPIFELAVKLDCPIHLSGGRYRPMSKALIGSQAERWLEPLWFDFAILGASALHPERGLFTTADDEAGVKRKACQISSQAFLLADASKLDSQAAVNFASWAEIDHWFTTPTKTPGALDYIRRAKSLTITIASK